MGSRVAVSDVAGVEPAVCVEGGRVRCVVLVVPWDDGGSAQADLAGRVVRRDGGVVVVDESIPVLDLSLYMYVSLE